LGKPTVTQGDGGFKAKSYAVEATVWAKWQWAHGQEVWTSNADQARRSATVMIRYRSDIDETWGVQKDGVWYDIVPPIDNILDRDQLIEMKVELLVDG
jgi:SPP1 family predicted phage head-tail adaptor